MSRWFRYVFGVLFCIGGMLYCRYAVRVAYAQIHYQRLKYRHPDLAFDDAHQASRDLHRMYPHNYHLSQWMAESAYYQHANMELSEYWVRLGLRQNPHTLSLRWIETILVGIAEDNPEEAARMWERYSDTVFWNRWVMAGRVYWLARADRIQDAANYLQILQRVHGNHNWAAEALEIAQKAYD